MKRASLFILSLICGLTVFATGACSSKEGKKTRLTRGQMNNADKTGEQNQTDNSDAAAAASARLDIADQTRVTSDVTCSLEQSQNEDTILNVCDALFVNTDEDGNVTTPQSLTFVENLIGGRSISLADIETLDDNKFKYEFRSQKGQNMDGEKEILYLTYTLPYNKSQLVEESLSIKINDNSIDLTNNNIVSVEFGHEDDSSLVALRIKDLTLVENINFTVVIEGGLKAEAVEVVVTAVSGDGVVAATGETTDVGAAGATGQTHDPNDHK